MVRFLCINNLNYGKTLADASEITKDLDVLEITEIEYNTLNKYSETHFSALLYHDIYRREQIINASVEIINSVIERNADKLVFGFDLKTKSYHCGTSKAALESNFTESGILRYVSKEEYFRLLSLMAEITKISNDSKISNFKKLKKLWLVHIEVRKLFKSIK